MTWSLYLRDDAYQRQGQIDRFVSFEANHRFNEVSTWELTVDRRSALAGDLTRPGWGVLLIRDGSIVLSGPATNWAHTVRRDQQRLTVHGADDTVWLARRLASPVPSASSPPYSAQEHDVRTGVGSTVLRAYANVNVGPGAVVMRRQSGLTIGTDPLVGSTVTGRARWQRLLTLLQELAVAAGNIGFRIVQVDAGIEFQVYQTTDRTASVKFSQALGNLAGFEYELTAPDATYVYVGGGGEGTARTVLERSDASLSTWGRIEAELRDRRDTTDTTELTQSALEILAESGPKTRLSIDPIDTAAVAYGVHYDLGDQVTVQLDDPIQDVIREVKISLQPGRQRVTPVVGTDRDTTPLLRAFRALRTRMVNLERR